MPSWNLYKTLICVVSFCQGSGGTATMGNTKKTKNKTTTRLCLEISIVRTIYEKPYKSNDFHVWKRCENRSLRLSIRNNFCCFFNVLPVLTFLGWLTFGGQKAKHGHRYFGAIRSLHNLDPQRLPNGSPKTPQRFPRGEQRRPNDSFHFVVYCRLWLSLVIIGRLWSSFCLPWSLFRWLLVALLSPLVAFWSPLVAFGEPLGSLWGAFEGLWMSWVALGCPRIKRSKKYVE